MFKIFLGYRFSLIPLLRCGTVVAQYIGPQTLNCEVPGSNLLAGAVVPLGKARYPHCLDPWKGLKVYLSP